MTNAQIIFNESVSLMEQGLIKGTGELIKAVVINEEGEEEEREYEMPEAIHTFAVWKKMGYKVKAGEHAVAKFPIWKYTEKKMLDDNKNVILDENGNEQVKSNMFMKMSAFFSAEQVERVEVK